MNDTLGHLILRKVGLNFKEYYYWISVAALVGLWIIYNIAFTVALAYLKCKFCSIYDETS